MTQKSLNNLISFTTCVLSNIAMLETIWLFPLWSTILTSSNCVRRLVLWQTFKVKNLVPNLAISDFSIISTIISRQLLVTDWRKAAKKQKQQNAKFAFVSSILDAVLSMVHENVTHIKPCQNDKQIVWCQKGGWTNLLSCSSLPGDEGTRKGWTRDTTMYNIFIRFSSRA